MNQRNFFAIGKHRKQLEELAKRFDAIASDDSTQPCEQVALEQSRACINKAIEQLDKITRQP